MIALNPIQLYDRGLGSHMLPVTPPGAPVSPSSSLAKNKKSLGKAPGRYGSSGWVGVDVNDEGARCDTYNTAKTWADWGANVGFVAGDGYAIIDNDQGSLFSSVITGVFASFQLNPLRRYVAAPKHHRDAFFVRVLDFVGDGVPLQNQNWVFKNGVQTATVQLLAKGKQAVIAGTHPETLCPYVFDRDFTGLEDIPVFSETRFGDFIRKFMDELGARGWTLVSPVSPLAATSPSVAIATPSVANGTPILDQLQVKAALQDAEQLLDSIPNRVVLKGETPTEADIWLDEYANWMSVAYALAAHLGPAIAATPEAEALWCEWSDGRPQGQPSASVWRSVIRGETRFGDIKLVELTRKLGAPPNTQFTELKPDDPALVPPSTPLLDELRSRWAIYAPGRGGFLELNTGHVVSPWTFNSIVGSRLPELLAEAGLKRRSPLQPSQIYTRYCRDVPVIDTLTFEPGQPYLIASGRPRHYRYNRWKRTSIPSLPVPTAEVQPWLDHIEFMLKGSSDADLFVRWCAFVAQHPELKPNWHFLFMSQQGLGKDTMMEPIKAAVGKGNWKTDVAKQLSNGFNDIFETKLLVIGETHQPKWTTHEIDSHLKLALARPPDTLWINPKGLPRYEIPNNLAVVMFSNDQNPLKLETQDRRTHVINCRDLQTQPQAYYDGLWDWLRLGGTELAARYLLTLPLTPADIQGFVGGTAPKSAAKTQLEQQNVDATQYALEALIADSRAGIGPFPALLATAEQLAEHIASRVGGRKPSSQSVNGILLDLETRNQGVRRLRRDPHRPDYCGTVSMRGSSSARLWALADKAPDGRDWGAFTNAELIGLWNGKPVSPPAKSNVVAFPQDPTV